MASAIENGQNLAQTIPEHSGDVAAEQVETVALPRRFSTPMREIWALQPRFHRRNGRRPERLAAHPRFRAAYDFLILRAAAGEETDELVQWWTEYQQGNAPVPLTPSVGVVGAGVPARRRPRTSPWLPTPSPILDWARISACRPPRWERLSARFDCGHRRDARRSAVSTIPRPWGRRTSLITAMPSFR